MKMWLQPLTLVVKCVRPWTDATQIPKLHFQFKTTPTSYIGSKVRKTFFYLKKAIISNSVFIIIIPKLHFQFKTTPTSYIGSKVRKTFFYLKKAIISNSVFIIIIIINLTPGYWDHAITLVVKCVRPWTDITQTDAGQPFYGTVFNHYIVRSEAEGRRQAQPAVPRTAALEFCERSEQKL